MFPVTYDFVLSFRLADLHSVFNPLKLKTVVSMCVRRQMKAEQLKHLL